MDNIDSLKFWTVGGFEISSYKWGMSYRKNSTYNYSATDETGKCTYTYNELGFRGDSIYKNGFKILSIGDSNTEGVGVNYDDTWPLQFSQYIPNSVNLNFGIAGRSNDYISRCLLTFYDLVTPDLVLIMYTSPQRREIHTKINTIEPFMPTSAWGYTKEISDGKHIQKNLVELQNNNEDLVNWYKNHLLIKYFLESKKCNWLWNGWAGIPTDYQEENRFDGKYSRFIDYAVDGLHSGPLHNKIYSNSLVKHILEKFPHFLPNNVVNTDIKISRDKLI